MAVSDIDAGAPAAIREFLGAATPRAWLEAAGQRLPELLIDHANCELKAASTALGMIHRYPERGGLCHRMSRLAREELRHFEQVRQLIDARGIAFRRLSASRYASSLHAASRAGEPGSLVDRLIVGALIEARSCERFAALVPRLPADTARFYAGLLASEARHFEHYLELARDAGGGDEAAFVTRVGELTAIENELILSPDEQFRFHSGVPA